MSPEMTVFAIVIIVAVLLDAALIKWMRRTQRLQKTEEHIRDLALSFRSHLGVFWLRVRTWHIFQPRPVAAIADPPAHLGEERELSIASSAIIQRPIVSETDSGMAFSRVNWLEWGGILLAVTLFCAGFLDLNAATRLPGNEAEVFQSIDRTLVNGLRIYGQFSLWNPYIWTGAPFIADPMLHIYNPVVTLPVLLFGVRTGFKLAVFFSFLIAAFGMWRLGKEMGFKAPARTWAALMYTFAGQPLAHFFQGQYLFVFGFAWIPWIVTGLFLVVRTRRRRYVVLTVLSLGLLFFSGNAYYGFYMAMIGLIFAIVMLPNFRLERPRIRIDGQLLSMMTMIAVLALGLVAIQLFPEMQFWPRIRKDMSVVGSHTPGQVFLDYTSKDPNRPDAYSQLPAREEYYAYIGLAPFLALALLPLAWKRRQKRTIIFLLLVILFVIAWVTLDLVPWREVLLGLPVLRQFRHLLRILVMGSFALILLAAFGLDELWQVTIWPVGGKAVNGQAGLPNNVNLIGSTFVIVFMVVSLVDLFQTNVSIPRSTGIHQPAYAVMGWLRQYDSSQYYVMHVPNNSWQDATISANLPYIEVWYHFADIHSTDGQINRRPVVASPKYIVINSGDTSPAGSGMQLIHQMQETNIYQDLYSLPMVFKLASSTLGSDAGTGPVTSAEVTPFTFKSFSPNRLKIAASGENDDVLVVLVSHYPGWTVAIDGDVADLQNVGGYLAVSMRPGEHIYTFSFRPTVFWAGLIVSLLAAAATLYLLLSDLDLSRRIIRVKRDQLATGAGQLGHAFNRAISNIAGKLKSGASVQSSADTALTVSPPIGWESTGELSLRDAGRRWLLATDGLLKAFTHSISASAILWMTILGIYLITRLVGLTQFPVYFFTDEAAQTILAGDLVRDHFRNYAGDFLPTYFENGGYYRLGVSVYAQAIPYVLFGKSIAVTRGTSVLITLLGVAALGLTLRNHFRLRFWWVGVLLFSLAPAWFLHSRTAFETAEAVSFFAVFIYLYLEYRTGRVRYLYFALLAGALAFYTYSPFQVIIVLCGLFLLLVDWRYHWSNRAVAGRGLLLLIVLAIPYLRFVLTHSQANLGSLAALGSIWVRPVSFSEKISTFTREYLHGLSPAYWFLPQSERLIRHEMKGYAYLPWTYLPLILGGFLISFGSFYQRWKGTGDETRAAAFRTAWICLLVVPFSAALVQVGITRLLPMTIPAILFAAVGLDWLLERVGRRLVPTRILALGVLVVLAGFNFWMLRDALLNGPTWYSDYGMSGLQYGTSQVFPAVQNYLRDHPGSNVIISPTWANGTDLLARFMLPEGLPVVLGSITGYMDQKLPLDQNTLFVLPPDEYQQAVESNKFTDIQVVQTLAYPDGRPGFYFLKLNYVPQIDQILTAESEQRHQLLEDEVNLDGQMVRVRYTRLDMGVISGLFDRNPNTVTRTLEANPYVIELTFPEPRLISGLSAIIGSSEVEITALRYGSAESEPNRQIARYKGSVEHPELSWDFDQPIDTRVLRLEVKDIHQDEPAHVHLWELKLR